MIEFSDTVLIAKDGELYRSEFGGLSSIIATYAMLDEIHRLSDTVSEIVDYLSSDDFLELFYTKQQLSSTFITVNALSSLLSNQTYALLSEASKAAAALSSKAQIQTWRSQQFGKNDDHLRYAYEYTKTAWDKSKGATPDKVDDKQQDHIVDFPNRSDDTHDDFLSPDLNNY